MWFDIIKSPIYIGATGDEPQGATDNQFQYLNVITGGQIAFISTDGNARAHFHFADNHWELSIFEIKKEIRRKGLGEDYLRELVGELRDTEEEVIDSLIDKLIDDRDDLAREVDVGSPYFAQMDEMITRLESARPPLDIIVIHIENARDWWVKMENKGIIQGIKG